MRDKRGRIGIAAVILGTLAGILAYHISWEELPSPYGAVGFWASRLFAGVGGLLLLALMIWAWKADREQVRLIDERAQFKARLERSKPVEFNLSSEDLSDEQTRH
ncbi:hypothetical protein [Rhizobium sp. FKY42]|uniref:hypothetical protein n=1 Tax=Rhizobium sp. FKY42 TaxID=2562310 RepID=UPI0010C01F78|nr:hypothetical protein [Rhizobium sp. FKY42]